MQHIIVGPYRTKVVVIKVFPLLKERRKIEQRLVQDAGLHKVQCYQQSANTPITIQERVDGLKLIVYNGYLYQIWHIYIGIVDELLKVTHQISKQLMVWWNITGIGDGGTANPVLTCAVFPWKFMLSADTVKQYLMSVSYETRGYESESVGVITYNRNVAPAG